MNDTLSGGAEPLEYPPSPIDILETRIGELEQMLGAAKDEQIRLIAEMDNQRKRSARDVDAARKYGAERLLTDLLPVIDSLEAGLAQGGEDATKLREGMQLTLRVLMKTVESNGVTAIDPIGQVFNPDLHQAVATLEAPDSAPGCIVSVFQKGFRLNERLVRPAMVAVAKDA
ncbi:MAG: nucleotide exchange factor GrpE [Pseudomonadota bacterium]|nr:nucleotide exchange factor GrpE [Pseudomonadota bacterium]